MSELEEYRQLFNLAGKSAVVIGGASGIGAAAVKGLAAHGAKVTVADLPGGAAGELARALTDEGAEVDAAPVDLTDRSSVDALFAARDRVDVLVCTPAVNVRKPLLDYSEGEFDQVLRLNLKGTFFAITAAGRHMARQGGGSIIALSSIRSQVVEPGQGVYAATKAGTLQMIRALAAELGPQGVRANAVAPGVVETPLTAPIKERKEWYDAYAEKSALGRWSTPKELAGAIVYLASDASSFVTGSLLLVDGGWTAVDGRFTPPLS